MGKARQRKAAAFIDDPLWYKDAVIYQVHVKSFFDSNNDGVGDFNGLIDKLDYIADLGVNTLWLLPFYPSPRRDDGYDISDYRGVHPDYGGLADVKRFIAEAHRRGLRVISELVINHTSDQHPWFQRARQAKPGSAARNYYVWSDTSQKYEGTRIIFLDTETSNWTWDPVAGAYFWHRFYSHQPDLNFDNPRVLQALLGIMRYWLDLGIDGLRLDAIPYLVEREGTNNENLPETHVVLKRIRAEIDAHYPDRMLLAEANQWPEDTQLYFGGNAQGGGDECHMAFHFPLMPRMYMALAQEDRYPITDILRQTPDIPADCQWAIFLRNHDELTLEMVTDRERDHLWNYYAADRRARINLGIRRRLAPLLERDRRRIELLTSLLLSMPGTPVLYYGDEIGMGDNIFLGDRDGVRTPMQWSIDRNGGFSRADPASLVLPPIMDPLYGYQTVNVEAQQYDAHSLLNWTRRLLAIRKQFMAFGRGSLKLLAPANRRILAYLREYQDASGRNELILCVVNVSRAAQAAELELSAYAGLVPVEMVGGSAFPPIGQLPYLLTLPPYGFYWFQLAAEAQMPAWHMHQIATLPEFQTLVLKRFEDLLQGPARLVLERESLPAYLPKRRWFAGKGGALERVRIAYALPFGDAQPPALLSEVEVSRAGSQERYQLPFGYIGEEETGSALPHQLAMARVRRGNRVGQLTDAFTLDSFVLALLQALREERRLSCEDGELQFIARPLLADLDLGPAPEVSHIAGEQSNSSVVIAGMLVFKLIRRVAAGIHPEVEMNCQLSAQGFAHIAEVVGEVRRVAADGEPHTLLIAQRYLESQGDAWAWTQSSLERSIRDEMSSYPAEGGSVYAALDELERFTGLLGERLGEMHRLLALPSADPDFAPQISTAADAEQWARSIAGQLERALDILIQHRGTLGPAQQAAIERLRQHPALLLDQVEGLARRAVGGLRIRVHGDLHLGQVLVVHGDAYLIDFEGEPMRSLAERRAKHSPYKDVCGVLRSIDYAAAMAMRNALSADISSEANQARRAITADYRQRSQAAFLAGYRLAAAQVPHAWREEDGAEAALRLFSLEKIAYEIAYEAEFRPDWLVVPLQGLLDLLQENAGGEP
ncbi:maltose alpha-D-glucosyltransferase [Pseudomonas sp. MMS21-TM103]|uniref:maltose alpha-D-glucosyltransferase n=1 Tax=Pseudomonas sp. MMS21 TM103 TaxID=2886506 RepID=UPI001EDD9C73|nr:maltose alpha-D-glucosyltransferase [Pseudomonas sp. MMS21 TM103]MCG4455687.1 maltose alpha-D-glucosyltransferase [Pseudomonas sp. MMS21 TM103]